MRWVPRGPETPDKPALGLAVRRGLMNHCPFCGAGRVFAGYLALVPACPDCAAPLGRLRADDAPPYFTIFIAGHLLVPVALMVEKTWMPPMWVHMALWLPLFTILCILLLRPIKGAVVGWMSALGMLEKEATAGPGPDA